jgi:hypothetical protein
VDFVVVSVERKIICRDRIEEGVRYERGRGGERERERELLASSIENPSEIKNYEPVLLCCTFLQQP